MQIISSRNLDEYFFLIDHNYRCDRSMPDIVRENIRDRYSMKSEVESSSERRSVREIKRRAFSIVDSRNYSPSEKEQNKSTPH